MVLKAKHALLRALFRRDSAHAKLPFLHDSFTLAFRALWIGEPEWLPTTRLFAYVGDGSYLLFGCIRHVAGLASGGGLG